MADLRFYKLPVGVAERRDLKASDKVVFAVLHDAMGNNGSCWPGVRTLSRKTGLAVSTVVESIGRLGASGELIVERRGNGRSSHYSTAESAPKTGTVDEPKRTENRYGKESKAHRKPNTGAPKTGTEAHRKPEPNQTDQLNQTMASTSFAFVLQSKKLWYLPQVKLDEYKGTFPNLDVGAELRKAAQWLTDNPGRRKTAAGMTRFLGGWLSRAKPKPEPKRGDPEWLPTDEEAERLLAEVSK